MVDAANSRDLTKVTELLNMGARSSAMDALMIAAVRAEKVDEVKWLLGAHANKDAKAEVRSSGAEITLPDRGAWLVTTKTTTTTTMMMPMMTMPYVSG